MSRHSTHSQQFAFHCKLASKLPWWFPYQIIIGLIPRLFQDVGSKFKTEDNSWKFLWPPATLRLIFPECRGSKVNILPKWAAVETDGICLKSLQVQPFSILKQRNPSFELFQDVWEPCQRNGSTAWWESGSDNGPSGARGSVCDECGSVPNPTLEYPRTINAQVQIGCATFSLLHKLYRSFGQLHTLLSKYPLVIMWLRPAFLFPSRAWVVISCQQSKPVWF